MGFPQRLADLPVVTFESRISEEPWEEYDAIRHRGGLGRTKSGRILFAADYALATDILTSEDFSVQHPFRSSRRALGPTLLDTEGAEHERLRSVLAPVFRRSSVEHVLDGLVTDELEHLWADVAADRSINWSTQIAAALPMRVLCRMLGVPPSHALWLRDLVEPVVQSIDTGVANTNSLKNVRTKLVNYLVQHFFVNSNEGPLGMAFLTAEADQKLTREECVRNIELLLVAGTATVAASLNTLIQSSACQQPLMRQDVDSIVREVLRLEPAVRFTPRFVRCRCERAGTLLNAGSLVLVVLPSANRDESVFPNGDTFDADRAIAPAPLTFGRGLHSCIGVMLANVQLAGVLRFMHERLRDFRVEVRTRVHYQWTLRSYGQVTLVRHA